MKYYKNEPIDILTMPTDYTLDNFYNIYRSINKISKNKILINDMHIGNIIMNNNDIIIIDIDYYDKEYSATFDKINKSNYVSLINLFTDIYIESLRNHTNPSPEEIKSILNLFSKSENVNMIAKKLKRYKYPIDYIKQNKSTI